jgi:hypothetical protein
MQIEKDTNTKLANIGEYKMPTPEYKTELRKIGVWKENTRRKRNLIEFSILHQEIESKRLKKRRKNVKVALKLRNKFQNSRNFSNFLRHKRQNSEKNFDMPSTPHNTGQYLISNYSQVRHEKNYNYSSDYLKKDIYENLIEYATMDDLCVTGGSMKGIINSHLFRRDSDDFSTSLSITNTYNTHLTDDDSMTATIDGNFNYSNLDCNECDCMCEHSEQEVCDYQPNQASFYKQKIEEQKRVIEFLMHKIQSQNG